MAPIGVSLAFAALWTAILAIPVAWFIFVFAWALGWAWLLLPFLGLPAVIFWQQHWIKGSSMVVGLVAVCTFATVPSINRSLSRRVADLVDVMYYRGEMQRALAYSQGEGDSPALGVQTIGGFGSVAWGFVLDPSGEILLPPTRRSSAWTAVSKGTELDGEDLEARHVIGDYYGWGHQ
jgi:hypothetical protein